MFWKGVVMRVQPKLRRNHHLLSTADLSRQELLDLLELMGMLKEAHKQGVHVPLLKDKVLGMIFEISSTRTRISFETAMTELGGHAEFLAMGNLQIGDGHETMRDTAEVVSRMTDAVIMRCNDHAYMEEFARFSYVPVFNGMTMDGHPTQALADVFTMMEHLPNTPLTDMVMMYMGDNNDNADKLVPIQRELMWMAAKLGMTYIACGPEEMWPNESDTAQFKRFAAENNSGAQLLCTTDPFEYIDRVDFTVSDSFVFGMPEDDPATIARHNKLFPRYQVNQALVDAGKPTLGVLHCLPCQRDEEITSEVLDGPHSLAFEEAENRLHAQKGILAWFMYATPKSEALQAYHQGRIESFLEQAQRSVPAAKYYEDHSEE